MAHGVIETSTGDLIRFSRGDYDFENDGGFDAGTETYRTDVPDDAQIRRPGEQGQYDRWDGESWVKVDQPAKDPDFIAGAKLGGSELVISLGSSWQTVDGSPANPGALAGNIKQAVGSITAYYKVTGSGAKAKLVEINADDLAEKDMNSSPVDVPDTSGQWSFLKFETDIDPHKAGGVYELRMQQNSAVDFTVKYVSISLMRKNS